ncbi:MAG: hypothetical protein F6K50_07440 [Moorea sp. SIO3I7]|uniref:hypothetical protein n=1 Tax=Moorena sp. SIO3I8 TaxID=2607833 RepID=UPI0013C03B18|nr:hypothetical protein [Moorena sp. SIO3I8]NEN95367.1 hypothetical protein [Moorena sp. SIO3I7]NEO05779.1 hypothetical protein [Moorena sp. SIO3I8]
MPNEMKLINRIWPIVGVFLAYLSLNTLGKTQWGFDGELIDTPLNYFEQTHLRGVLLFGLFLIPLVCIFICYLSMQYLELFLSHYPSPNSYPWYFKIPIAFNFFEPTVSSLTKLLIQSGLFGFFIILPNATYIQQLYKFIFSHVKHGEKVGSHSFNLTFQQALDLTVQPPKPIHIFDFICSHKVIIGHNYSYGKLTFFPFIMPTVIIIICLLALAYFFIYLDKLFNRRRIINKIMSTLQVIRNTLR